MLKSLLKKLSGFDIIVIDDGSEWSKDKRKRPRKCQFIRTIHEGKKGFWRKWVVAHSLATSSNHNYFLFIADDMTEPDIEILEMLTNQGWDDNLFAISPLNTNRYHEWGKHSTGHGTFELGDYEFIETGFIDCTMFTNRTTLEAMKIEPVKKEWFRRQDRSSGVGKNITMELRELEIPMFVTKPSIFKHGNHESVMHRDHRKNRPLLSV